MANMMVIADELTPLGLVSPTVSADFEAALTETGTMGLIRLIATAEESMILNAATGRGLHGFKIMQDPTTAGEYVMLLKSVENAVAAAAAASLPPILFTKVLEGVTVANQGGAIRRQLVNLVEASNTLVEREKLAARVKEEKRQRLDMEHELEQEASARNVARLAAGAAAAGAMAGAGGGGGLVVSMDEVSDEQERKLLSSFRETFAFELSEAKYGNRTAQRTMMRHIVEQRRWPSEEEMSYLKIRSAEGGGARPRRIVQVEGDGTLAAGVKEENPTDPKGTWQVVRLYARKLTTALLVAHKVEAWVGYDVGRSGKAPKDPKQYVVGLNEVIGLVDALEQGAKDGIKPEAMSKFIDTLDAEIRSMVVGSMLMTPGNAMAQLVGQTRRALALSVGTFKEGEKAGTPKKEAAADAVANAAKDKTNGQKLHETEKKLGELKRQLGGGKGGGGKAPRYDPNSWGGYPNGWGGGKGGGGYGGGGGNGNGGYGGGWAGGGGGGGGGGNGGGGGPPGGKGSGSNGTRPECADFRNGRCTRGTACRFSH